METNPSFSVNDSLENTKLEHDRKIYGKFRQGQKIQQLQKSALDKKELGMHNPYGSEQRKAGFMDKCC